MAAGDQVDEFGPYRIVREIGSGGMARIFEATDTRLGHRVAIKRLHSHVAERPGATDRFLREGRAAARVRHPNVVQVFALGTEGAGAYLAMELLEGCDLGAMLARGGPLDVEAALGILLPVTAAVAAAHDAGVVHRDLKPSNVFVSRGPGGRPCPKVVDFGVSKVLAPDDAASVTATDTVVGTAAYMAPEQARVAKEASFQSDQYSLAVILYQCLTGALPFSGTSIYELFSAIMTAPVASPSQRAGGIPGALDAIVLRAMSRNPRSRFPSVRAFGAALIPFARPCDRSAWSTELHPGPADGDALPPERVELERVTPAGKPVISPTMPPTARDSRASKGRKRAAPRTLVGMLATIGVVVATGTAWMLGHGGGERAETAPNPTPSIAGSTPPDPSSSPRDTIGRSSDLRTGDVRSFASTIAPTPPAPSPTVRSPAHRAPRRTPSVTGSTSADASVRPPPSIGDNGAPILP